MDVLKIDGYTIEFGFTGKGTPKVKLIPNGARNRPIYIFPNGETMIGIIAWAMVWSTDPKLKGINDGIKVAATKAAKDEAHAESSA